MRRTGFHHAFHDLQRECLVLHQRRTGPLVAHLLGGAAHVDVDDLGATRDVVARGLGHFLGFHAGDLDGDRPRLATVVGAARGFQAVPELLLRRHHLADRMAGTKAPAQLAERPVRHPRHGGDEHGVRQGELGQLHGGSVGVAISGHQVGRPQKTAETRRASRLRKLAGSNGSAGRALLYTCPFFMQDGAVYCAPWKPSLPRCCRHWRCPSTG